MARLSIVFGALLAVVGIGGYVATDMVSPTALIPAFLGLLLIVAGVIAGKESMRKHAMHGAALIALIGIAGTASRTFKLPALLSGEAVKNSGAIYSSAITFLLSAVFLALCVKSFIDARKARKI